MQSIRCISITDEEMQLIEQRLGKNPNYSTCGYQASGLATEEDIAALEQQGILVERIPASIPIGWLEPADQPVVPELLRADLQPGTPLNELAAKGLQHYVVQFDGPLAAADQDDLDQLGVILGSYVPEFANKVTLNPDQHHKLTSRGYVRRIVDYDTALTLRRVASMTPPLTRGLQPTVVSRAAGPQTGEVVAVMYHVRCHDSADLPAVALALSKDPRVLRVEQGRNRIRIETVAGKTAKELEAAIAKLPQVSIVEPFEFPTLECTFVRSVLAVQQQGGVAIPWQGDGQVVAVTDSGVDANHPDLIRCIDKVIERVAPEGPDDPFGHGTHVCSIIAGDGSASSSEIKGIAPQAKLLVQGIRAGDGKLIYPVDLAELFIEAYDLGARIHNNSWGDRAGKGIYSTDAFEIDQFVHEHPDSLLVFAAGNFGVQDDPASLPDPEHRISLESLTTVATAKNVLTVGACCSSRMDGPYGDKPWRQYRGALGGPQHAPLADAPICGDAEVMAAFSSRGPSDDSRVKPDLVAPGTDVLAARSSPSVPSFPEAAFNGHYAYMCGTSMAAPAAAGAAAIVREYFIKVRQCDRPSAALLKAALINGAVWSKAPDAQDPNVGEPNFHQGFGRLNLARTLPLPGNAEHFSLQFVDIYSADANALKISKVIKESQWKRRIRLAEGLPLSITLCWTDHPAHGLQQFLHLLVESPSKERLVGNPRLVRQPWLRVDRSNNVQRLTVENPTAGDWTIIVNASSTPHGPQGFSLVATGCNLSDFF